jgi:hypothetical protein
LLLAYPLIKVTNVHSSFGPKTYLEANTIDICCLLKFDFIIAYHIHIFKLVKTIKTMVVPNFSLKIARLRIGIHAANNGNIEAHVHYIKKANDSLESY